jgi:hypothetical protein
VRAVRYSNFLATWVADVPAVILYAPNYTYVTSPNVNGVKAKKLVEPADRFYGIEDWTVKVKQVER